MSESPETTERQPTQQPRDRISALRGETLGVLGELVAKAGEYELPEPPPALGQQRQQMEENRYTVLVVGETRRGKSSFINALIGRPLLPVDVEVTTSQIFRIRQGEGEHYRLRFLDGSTREIGADELGNYGSQVVADAGEMPRLDQIIDCIEIEIPLRFLPPEIELLDTPGLGALFAAHTQLTHRFIPQADAVIYTLDSTQPIGQLDINTLEAILTATSAVFFIQTKIDNFSREQWQALQQRNEQILRERFGERLADPRVWPISSKHLLQAAKTGDEEDMIDSQHRHLAVALNAFLYRVAGISRAATALYLGHQYQVEGAKTLVARLVSLQRESTQSDGRTIQLKTLKRDWDRDWGGNGIRRRTLQNEMSRLQKIARDGFSQSLDRGGEIDKQLRGEIRALTDPSQAQALAEHIKGQLPQLCHERWMSSYQRLRDGIVKEVAPFFEAAANLTETSRSIMAEGSPKIEDFKVMARTDPFEKASRAVIDFSRAGTIVTVGGAATAALASTVLTQATLVAIAASPVGVVVVAAAGIWAIYRGVIGWINAGETQLRNAQAELERHLAEALLSARKFYFDVNQTDGRESLVDEQLKALYRSMAEEVDRLSQQRSRELAADIERLDRENKLDAEQRPIKVAALREQNTGWEGLGDRLLLTMEALNQLDRELSASPSAATS